MLALRQQCITAVQRTAYTSMRLHVAAVTVVTTCCFLVRLEAFVAPRLVVCGRASMHLPEQPTQQHRQHHQQKQRHHHHHHHHHQLRVGMGTRHSLNYYCSVGASRMLHKSSQAGWTTRKHTPLQQQQQQCSSQGDARRVPGKDARSESLLVRWGSASGETGGGGGGEESSVLLLRMDFEDADVEGLRNWIRRYPFGVALPVQPFSLVETEMGVDVVFRKKPTLGKGSQDGGLSFTVIDSGLQEGVDLPSGPALIMRRNSEGQQIRKVFAERIVVKAIVQSLAGDGSPPPPAGTKVRTVLPEGLV